MKTRIILVGKAGSGKDYLRNKMCERGFTKEISYTTRPPRKGEENGIDYYFVDKEFFEKHLDKFYEYQQFNGWYYGTTKRSWELCDIFIFTPSGVAQISNEDRKKCWIIYLDIHFDTRKKRLLKRSDADSVERRMIADFNDFKDFVDYDQKITNSNF